MIQQNQQSHIRDKFVLICLPTDKNCIASSHLLWHDTRYYSFSQPSLSSTYPTADFVLQWIKQLLNIVSLFCMFGMKPGPSVHLNLVSYNLRLSPKKHKHGEHFKSELNQCFIFRSWVYYFKLCLSSFPNNFSTP